MTVAHIEDMYPLSPMQQGMLFHSLYAPTSGVYVTQSTGAIHSHLNILAFERAWQRVIDRHPILRTAFVWEDLDEPVQVVCRGVELPLEHQDWRGLSPVEREERLEKFLQAERARGFELSQAPLMRLALIRMADRIYQFVWSHHHVLLDGWSLPLLIQEIFTFYEAFCQGHEIHLEPSRPYKDYFLAPTAGYI
jgi:NRPS condensation-like uncharacterized protein